MAHERVQALRRSKLDCSKIAFIRFPYWPLTSFEVCEWLYDAKALMVSPMSLHVIEVSGQAEAWPSAPAGCRVTGCCEVI